MRVTLKALHYFMTAVERSSITRAAEELHVVPSAVSAAIDLVEEEFALKLVMRYPSKGIQPTATGQILLGKFRHLLEEYNNLLIEGSDLRTALTGTLRVGYYAPIAPAFMPDIIIPMVDGNPDVSVTLVECDNETAQGGLLNGDFDVILFAAENVKPQIAFETLLEVPAYILAPAAHALATRKSATLADLAEENLVLLDLPVMSEYYRGILEDAGIAPRIVATANTTEMIRSLVGADVGCSILNMRPLNHTSYAGDPLAAVPVSPAPKPLRLVLGHIQENPRRLVHAFVEQCRSYFTSDAARRMIVE